MTTSKSSIKHGVLFPTCQSPHDDVRDHANRQKALNLATQWHEAGYHVTSMKDDLRTIHGSGVEKVDFTFQ